ncbi:MAG: hypothetical protein MJE68_09385, partial [Proteobacteria bacterium]|nr:hypothetical protein [Pseudomonadota bacterium]
MHSSPRWYTLLLMDTTLANAIQYYDHAADCGIPVSNAKLNYTSTLEGSILTLICENEMSNTNAT